MWYRFIGNVTGAVCRITLTMDNFTSTGWYRFIGNVTCAVCRITLTMDNFTSTGWFKRKKYGTDSRKNFMTLKARKGIQEVSLAFKQN